MSSKLKYADIFCGCGGLTYGFNKNKLFEGVLGVDYSGPAGDVYLSNFPNIPFWNLDLQETENVSKVIKHLSNNCDVLLGGPPCQGFSTLGKRSSFDIRSQLIDVYLKIVNKVNPSFIIMENVKGIRSMRYSADQTYPEHIKSSLCRKYTLTELMLDASDFGMAQTRVRYILVGVKKGLKMQMTVQEAIESQVSKYKKTLLDVIGDLPQIDAGGGGDIIIDNTFKSKKIYNHKAMKHSPSLIERLSHVPVGGGLQDVPRNLLNDHLINMLNGKYGSGGHAKNIYGRLDWNKPAGTIVAGIDKVTCGRFVHPTSHRLLTPRECARIQSFSDDFIFSGSLVAQYYMIGNAVPPKWSSVFSNMITKIKGRYESNCIL